jgi:23S rRNA (guanosine2251-2'-O)-methyltransferase
MNDPHSYPQRSQERLPPQDQLIMGIQALSEVLRYARERLLKVYTVPAQGKRKHDLLEACEERGVPIQFVSSTVLTKMAGSDSHQSFVAHMRGRHFYDVRDFLEGKPEATFILMLDQIFDPQNFGAILRSAECFGVDGVAWSKNRGCDLTPVVAKVSAGASELMPLLRVSNLATSVDQLKKADFEVVAAVADPKAELLSQTFCYPAKTVLIVGSEGEGIQPLLLKKADRLLSIPLQGRIASLNVAQATAILLSSHLLQRRPSE